MTFMLGGLPINNPNQLVPSTPSPAAGSPAPQANTPGYFWKGADGKVYVQGSQGINAAGNWDANTANYWSSRGFHQTPDSPVAPPAASGGSSAGGGSAAAASGGGHLSQSVIDAVMQSIANDIAQNQGNYNNALRTNQENQANGDKQYGTDITNNTEGRAQSIQQAEQAGAQGLQGLQAVLASLGALNGTGSILAGRAVAHTTNNDIGSANQTFQTNDQAIRNAKSAYDTGYNQENANLKTALDTDNKAASATGYQDLLDQANSIGDTSLYSKYLPLAVGATTPTQAIAPNVIPVSQASTASFGASSPFTVKLANQPSTAPIAPAAGLTPTNSALSITKDNS